MKFDLTNDELKKIAIKNNKTATTSNFLFPFIFTPPLLQYL